MDAATLTYDTLRFGEIEDFPETTEPVWILGKEYSALTEKDEILSDVTSRLWFTYRKSFPPIGGTGPTSDTGWGCMLRCGQMILGQALMCKHLGRDWRWVRGQKQRHEYINLLNAFIDKKDSYYSIHQIAQMGVGEGKPIGQWYGPNTVAQVLKKLAVFDTWSRLVVHVAMDNTVVIEEIKRLCMPWLDKAEVCAASEDVGELNGCLEGACAFSEEETALWKPLVLLIPLRLGLTDINEAYIETLKKCFMLPQSLGVIGGKPNSAHYFIGYVGGELIYLDPHTTQTAVEPCEDGRFTDDTYHCQHPPCRMHICELDPSIAAGFFCRTEDEFDDWCMRIRRLSCNRDNLPMFELVDSQPSHMVSVDAINLTPAQVRTALANKDQVTSAAEDRFTRPSSLRKSTLTGPQIRAQMNARVLVADTSTWSAASDDLASTITSSEMDQSKDFSDSERLERFFDSEDEEFEILSL